MKIVANLVVHNELDRYLKSCVESLLTWVDEIRAWDDGSTDGSYEYLKGVEGVEVAGVETSTFMTAESLVRNDALSWALTANPTHIVAIDCDEFVEDGPRLRKRFAASGANSWQLCMEEVWNVGPHVLQIRKDGLWPPHPIVIGYRVPANRMANHWRIPGGNLACGRLPQIVIAERVVEHTGQSILHFGWANKADREARYQRYMTHDSGAFHQRAHLDSIVFPDSRMSFCTSPWPKGLEAQREAIVKRALR